MQEAVVRVARQADMDELLGLLGELGRPCGADSGPPARVAAAAILRRDDTHVLIAEQDGRAGGAACLLLLPRLGYASPEARLLDLVVTAERQAGGIGRQLLAAVVELASGAGCHALRLECGHRRTGAQRFYRRLGFESRGEDWQLPLPRPAGDGGVGAAR